MFVRGMGDYTSRGWKVENWLPASSPTAAPTITSDVVKTAAVATGGALGIAALAAAAWWLFKK